MADALALAVKKAQKQSDILSQLALPEKQYLLATVHRAENTNNPTSLRSILEAFNSLEEPLIFIVHPRTHKALQVRLHGPICELTLFLWLQHCVSVEVHRIRSPATPCRSRTPMVDPKDKETSGLNVHDDCAGIRSRLSPQPPLRSPPFFKIIHEGGTCR